ncbi:hypothetical protein FHL15_008415 [Xylaria flabelliformis]|uniref:Uncharacterized protein n=1 Tax=Xylaria flabelliformis TaxID=2512241 RepID=A0A553HRS7_9PEZI|nr:hypothetical protein FHL15_008415 [Xylaria flabelliformis]
MSISMQNTTRWQRETIGEPTNVQQDGDQSNISLARGGAIQGAAKTDALRLKVITVLYHGKRFDHNTITDTAEPDGQHK